MIMPVRVNGKAIQRNILRSLRERVAGVGVPPRIAIFHAASDIVSSLYVKKKISFAAAAGVPVHAEDISRRTPEEIKERIGEYARDPLYRGIVVQLPLPPRAAADTEEIIDAIPAEKDIDILSDRTLALFEKGATERIPPVAGAIREIFRFHDVSLRDKNIVIMGRGRLVGRGVAAWLRRDGHTPVVLDKESRRKREYVADADILISGTGVPGLITPEMVKKGAILIDAGMAEKDGRMAGDIDTACFARASLYAPATGGVGPVAIAILFDNLLKK